MRFIYLWMSSLLECGQDVGHYIVYNVDIGGSGRNRIHQCICIVALALIEVHHYRLGAVEVLITLAKLQEITVIAQLEAYLSGFGLP